MFGKHALMKLSSLSPILLLVTVSNTNIISLTSHHSKDDIQPFLNTNIRNKHWGVCDIILCRQCMKASCSAREGTILVEVIFLYLLTCDHYFGPIVLTICQYLYHCHHRVGLDLILSVIILEQYHYLMVLVEQIIFIILSALIVKDNPNLGERHHSGSRQEERSCLYQLLVIGEFTM